MTWRVLRQPDHFRDFGVQCFGNARWMHSFPYEAVDAVAFKALTPAPDASLGLAGDPRRQVRGGNRSGETSRPEAATLKPVDHRTGGAELLRCLAI